MRCHPSTSTNNISFIGSETITGDIIIMPIDIRTLATTMSMTRKGMKMMKPDLECRFQFAGDECRDQYTASACPRLFYLLDSGQSGEKADIPSASA